MERIRTPAVAGVFYPGEREELRHQVGDLLGAVRRESGEAAPPKALVVPHAGYRYSGPVAASGFASLDAARDRITRVVLLGPSHCVPLEGIALSRAGVFRTPLGDIEVDRGALEVLAALPQVSFMDRAHDREHSLEVPLPFLQEQLDSFTLVPLVVGQTTPEQVAEVLEAVWNGPETLLVASSDLSHFLDDETARAADAATCRKIVALDYAHLGPEDACGCRAVAGLLLAAARHHLTPATLDLRTSGDIAGPRDRVVGYGAWAFRP